MYGKLPRMSLSEYIKNDIISHLSLGKKPCKLTVSSIAEHYGVSSTPVRDVIKELIESGQIIKLDNGRLKTANDSSAINNKGLIQDNTKDPYEIILREIVHRSLHSEDIFLREESTAERYGLSRSAVREICHTISGQGLLEHIPRRGWKIRSFTQKDLHAYSEVREVMELKALNLSWGKLLDIDLQAMLDGNIPAKKTDIAVIDNRLHAYIIEKADNFYVNDFFSRHEPFFKILFEWEGEDSKTAGETVQQHHDILNALLNRDKEIAAKALSFHIHHNHPILENLSITDGTK